MNVLGEGFPKEIIDQIYVRQRAYGSGYSNGVSRTADEILYLNANTAWCKLISSTDIDNIGIINNPTIKQLGLTGTELAKKFILFNGTSDEGGLGLRAGIDLENNLTGNNKAYGIGGTEFGIRPMMGIQTVSVTHENRGSLRQASVKLKAWNKTQLEIIDILYLRLGFSVLLEWGNSMYFNDKYEFQTNVNNSLANEFLDGKYTYNQFLQKIQDKRIESLGNYDAMFAKVKNFHWSFLQDGSYDITLDLISCGDIIESLKINAIIEDPLSIKTEKNPEPVDDEDDDDVIDAYIKRSSIGQFFYYLKYQLTTGEYKKTGKTFSSTFGLFPVKTTTFSFSDFPNGGEQQQNVKTESENTLTNILFPSIQLINSIFDTNYFQTEKLPIELNPKMFAVNDFDGKPLKVIDAIIQPWDDKSGNDDTYYVRFGTFLAFLQNYLIPRGFKNKEDKGGESILNVDYDQNTNLMYVHRWQVSVDPRICIAGREINIISSYDSILGSSTPVWQKVPFQTSCSPFINEKYSNIAKGVEYGNIMNIYINMRYVLMKMDELKDDKNKVSLYDLLKGICDGINEGLGGINSLEPIIDEVANVIKIIDTNPLPNKDKILEKINSSNVYKQLSLNTQLASFDLFKYDIDSTIENSSVYNGLGHASFIKNFSFTTEITPELATMITVGAASNGKVVGENQTALSKLNNGLSDRYRKEVLDIYEIKKREKEEQQRQQEEQQKQQEEFKATQIRYVETIKEYFDWLEELSDNPPELLASSEPTLNVDEVDVHKGTLLNIIQYESQIKAYIDKQNQINNTNTVPNIQPFTGFIPFNLSLTMDGLSGMKIYSKFIVDTSYLPSNYPGNVEFLIKGITHEISNNKWFTKLESFCISKGNFEDSLYGSVKSDKSNSPLPSVPYSNVIVPSNNKVGALPYDNSDVAKSLKARGKQNGLLDINDPSVLQKLTSLPLSADKKYYPDGYWRLHPSAAKAYISFSNAAKSAGFNWTLSSAYRSFQHQSGLGSNSTVASPGSSPHGWGGAIDISELRQAVGGSGAPYVNSLVRQNNPLYKWMAENGPRFGWYNPYRLADGSGLDECWHWEYWGSI
jgi:hypothetical protein